jgi:hypothetical protein
MRPSILDIDVHCVRRASAAGKTSIDASADARTDHFGWPGFVESVGQAVDAVATLVARLLPRLLTAE